MGFVVFGLFVGMHVFGFGFRFRFSFAGMDRGRGLWVAF